MFNTTLTELYGVVPFDETLVLYDPSSPLSLPSVLLSLSPILILTFYLSWLILDRDIESVIVAGGQLCNEFANKILKRVLKQPRPHEALIGPGYGMPSAHSQFAGFFFAYWTLRLWIRWHNPHMTPRRKWAASFLLLVSALLICMARIHLRYHTVEQTAVGFAVGVLLATLYFAAVGIARTLGVVRAITQWPAARRLHIHDEGSDTPVPLHLRHLPLH